MRNLLLAACLVSLGFALPASACDQARAEAATAQTVGASAEARPPAETPDAKGCCGGAQGCCAPAAGTNAEGQAQAPAGCGCGAAAKQIRPGS